MVGAFPPPRIKLDFNQAHAARFANEALSFVVVIGIAGRAHRAATVRAAELEREVPERVQHPFSP
jgi:hypothetical protein